jgi:hypothetical protein
MAEQAFAPDFLFSRIKNVNFGTPAWLQLSNGGANPALPGVEFDFVDVAGGTPGFILPQAFHESPGGIFKQAPAFMSQGDVTAVAHMNAGHPVRGIFGEWFNLFEGGGTTLWFGLSTMPQKFKVRFSYGGDGSLVAGVSFFKPNRLKAGVDPGGLSPDAGVNQVLSGSPVVVQVDVKAGTVVQL